MPHFIPRFMQISFNWALQAFITKPARKQPLTTCPGHKSGLVRHNLLTSLLIFSHELDGEIFTMWCSNKLTKQLSALKILFPALWISRKTTINCWPIINMLQVNIPENTIKLKFTALNAQLVPSKEFDLTELLEKAPPSGQTKVQTLLNDLNGWKSAKNLKKNPTHTRG